MAQTGYTPILIYSSSTASNAPAVGNLTNSTLGSELAINITDGKLFYKDNANAIQVIGWKTVPATAGGTGQTSYAVGDILYASSTTALSKLADVATGNALISGGVGVAPAWGKIGLTTHVSGTLPIANGGTNQTSFTSPASSIAGLTYFDGTSLVNNGTPSRLGFNASSNTFYATTQVSGSANAQIAGIGGYTPQIQTHAGDTNSSGFGVFAYTAGGVGRYQLNRSKSTTIGTNTALASGDVVGIWQNGAADGTGFIDCADIRAYVDGAVSTNSVPGRLSFWTNSGSSVNPLERMTIYSSGGVSIGNTTDPGATNLSVTGKIQTTSGTFLNAGASVTCSALNTYYTVQQYYFGLYVFRDGTSGGTAMVLYDSTGATIVSSTITGLGVQVSGFSTLQVRVTSGSAPRTLYWACVAAVSS